MNSTIQTILNHRSIRKFTSQPIESEQLDAILQAGLAASSSSMLQVVSIIRVTNKAFDDFAGGETDQGQIRRMLGLS